MKRKETSRGVAATVVMKSRPFHRRPHGVSGRGKDTVFRGSRGYCRGMSQVRGDEVVVDVV